MQELDATPFIRELERAIMYLASGKSPGKDGDQPEVVKAGKDTSTIVTTTPPIWASTPVLDGKNWSPRNA